ncbi:hypothetical protein CP533_0990 [Ophiocordyceps camponoti-saundersi (nom. inval.)]|nr:hypothetical protein CP533_0990 [Ophiocordyceps camponoti-saundersi (nom. inval.)]
MRSSSGALSLAVLIRLVGADSSCLSITSQFPDCALSCVKEAASKVGCTNTADLACQCTPASSAAILATAQPCVVSCGIEQAVPAIKAGSSLCACVASATQAPIPSSTSLPPFANSSAPAKQASQPGPYWYGTTLPKVTTTSAMSEPTSTGHKDHPSPISSGKPLTTEAPCSADCGAVASSAVPRCAQPCFSSYVPQVGCDITDYQCQCQPAAQQSLSQLLVPCVATACPPEAIPSVISGASSVCACASAGADCGGSGTDFITKTETRFATVTSCETDEQSTPVETVTQPLPPKSESPPSCSGQPDCGGQEQKPTPTESCSEMPQPSCPGHPDSNSLAVSSRSRRIIRLVSCLNRLLVSLSLLQANLNLLQANRNLPPVNLNHLQASLNLPPVNLNHLQASLNLPPVNLNLLQANLNLLQANLNLLLVRLNLPLVNLNLLPASLNPPPVNLNHLLASLSLPLESFNRLRPSLSPPPVSLNRLPASSSLQPPSLNPQAAKSHPQKPQQPCNGQPGCAEEEKPKGKPSGSGKPPGGEASNKPTAGEGKPTSLPPPPKEAAPSVVQPGSAGRCQVGLAAGLLGAFWATVLLV